MDVPWAAQACAFQEWGLAVFDSATLKKESPG